VVHINGYAADAKRAKKELKKNVLWVKPNQEFKDFMTSFRSGERPSQSSGPKNAASRIPQN
jgi:hypothetical protein